MTFPRNLWKCILALACLAYPLLLQAAPGRMLREDALRREVGGPVLATLALDSAVEILERQGGWLRLSTAQGEGWVRLLSVRGEVAARVEPVLTSPGLDSRLFALPGTENAAQDDGRAALAKLETHRLLVATHVAQAAMPLDAVCGLPPTPVATRTASPVRKAPLSVTKAAPAAHLPLIAAWRQNRLSAEDEARIGRILAQRLLTVLPAVDDSALQDYLNRVGSRVLTAQASDQPWLFAVLDSEEAYSFSMPGGYVFITRGLYRLPQDEAELVALLAREIAHVGDKRLLLDLGQNAPDDLGTSGDESVFLQQLLGGGLDALLRPYSVESEYQADHEAVLLAARAGYDPYALAAFLQTLGGLAEGDPRLALLSRTYPRADARLVRLARTLEDCLAVLPTEKTLEPPLYRMNH